MTETPKRLAPTRDTLRELYLKAGNRCAFPGCNKALFNRKGVLVGQICHIEAAEPGGPRFNQNQTNEQRRNASNLVLMCYDHHVETDDVSKFPVEQMARIKTEHEKLFSDVVGSMLRTVTDHTTLTEPIFVKNLKKLDKVLCWNSSKKELLEGIKEINAIVSQLMKVPRPSRELFLIMINRGKSIGGLMSSDIEVSAPEIQQATNLSSRDFKECFSILEKYGFTCYNDINDFGVQMIGVTSPPSGWRLWRDLKIFCKKQNIDLAQMIINLDFSVHDE